jgi:hypothetical protein
VDEGGEEDEAGDEGDDGGGDDGKWGGGGLSVKLGNVRRRGGAVVWSRVLLMCIV